MYIDDTSRAPAPIPPTHDPDPPSPASPPPAHTPPHDGFDPPPARFDPGEPVPPPTADDLPSKVGRPPSEVNIWWKALGPEGRDKAIQERPDLVGWLDGVPAVDRNKANRIMLDRHQADLQQQAEDKSRRIQELRTNPGQNRADQQRAGLEIQRLEQDVRAINDKRAKLDSTERKLESLGDKGLLLGIDPAGDGRAVISIGNPDTAKHTAIWVPGLETDLGDTSSNLDRVKNLQSAADQITAGEANDVAGIMWLGYDAPETNTSVLGDDRSKAGGKALDGFVNGLRASHEGGPQQITAVGHSYGSTVVAEAALEGDGLAVDDIVTAGSPGMHTDRADNLKINGDEDAHHVWAGSAKNDPVSDFSNHKLFKWTKWLSPIGNYLIERNHGESPQRADFGANRYQVDTEGHSDYWREGSASVHNQAAVVVGKYSEVGIEHGHKPEHDWIG